MGQKVHPTGYRLGVIKESSSCWYSDKNKYADLLAVDLKIREYLGKNISRAAMLSEIRIERSGDGIKVTLRLGKPGVVIGRKGEDVEKHKQVLSQLVGQKVHINIEEVRKPELDAAIVAETIAQQLEKRVMFRRAMKRPVQTAMRLGAKGIKILVSGRLGGAEIARKEWYREGRVPLHTLRADIDYANTTAQTTYGVIGVKVWIFKGEVLKGLPTESVSA